MYSRRTITRRSLLSLSFVLLYLLLNRPEVVLFSNIGFVAWYPAIGLVMALMLGISPWYAVLAFFTNAFTNTVLYAQPVLSFSNTIGAAGIASSYGTAAYWLRGPLKIDLGLRRRRDVVRYLLVSAIAATAAAVFGVATLLADHSITWPGFWAMRSAWWRSHHSFSSMYFPAFVRGCRRYRQRSDRQQRIPEEGNSASAQLQKSVAKLWQSQPYVGGCSESTMAATVIFIRASSLSFGLPCVKECGGLLLACWR